MQEYRKKGIQEGRYSSHKYLLLVFCELILLMVCRYCLFLHVTANYYYPNYCLFSQKHAFNFCMNISLSSVVEKNHFLAFGFWIVVNFPLLSQVTSCTTPMSYAQFLSQRFLVFRNYSRNVCQPVVLFCNSLLYYSFW